MARFPVDRPWELVISGTELKRLTDHLFPGDGDEHGAVILAGIHILRRRVRLLTRLVIPAVDGIDHVSGKYGYKMLRAQFIRDPLIRARNECLVYLSVHNHAGSDRVEFSTDDLASHERGYPALLDIVQGMPVGALVMTRAAVAGDIWLPNGARVSLMRTIVVDSPRRILRSAPVPRIQGRASSIYDRQVRLFGEEGQQILRAAKIAIVGLGGVGSLLAELLGRLGVGNFVLIDPDRADTTNLPRLIAARRWDALIAERPKGWFSPFLDCLRRRKIDLAARNIKRANASAVITRVFGSILERHNVEELLECDYVFLSADTMTARLIFNAVVHQFLIPGIQVGARVVTDSVTGAVADVFAVSRPVTPSHGCLWCNSLIDPTKLQVEATEKKQARAQDYGTESAAPSVVTLNALAAAEAANTFMFYMTGLSALDGEYGYIRFRPLTRSTVVDEARTRPDCPECGRGEESRFARGDGVSLPTRPG